MSLANLLVIIAVIAIVVILIASGKLRALISAIGGKLIVDVASTPEGAESLFDKEVEDAEEKFRKVDAVYKKVVGQRKRCMDELTELKTRLSTVESQCERLAKAGDDEGLTVKVDERADIMEDIHIHEVTMKDLDVALKDTTDARKACEDNLTLLRKKKKRIITQMKRNESMKDIYADLEGIGSGSNNSKLLNKVIERGDELQDLVVGSKEAYETKASTKAKKVDQRLRSSANDDYKQQLLNKYKSGK